MILDDGEGAIGVLPTGVRPLRVVILAPSGWGKSKLASEMAPMFAPRDRLLIVSPQRALAASMPDVKWYDVPTPDKNREAAEAFFQKMHESPEHWFMILDEADMYMGGGHYGAPSLKAIINLGRERGHGIMMLARGSSEISKNALGTADLTLWGRVTETNAIDWAHHYMAHAVPDIDNVLQTMPHRMFLVYTPQSTPQFRGFLRYVEGRGIVTWEPNGSEAPAEGEPPTSSEPSPEATSPDGTASTPSADGSSPTDGPPATAGSTTPSTTRNAGES